MKQFYGSQDIKKVKRGDRIRFHDPVKGNHTGIVMFNTGKSIKILPETTYDREPITWTSNHSLLEILE